MPDEADAQSPLSEAEAEGLLFLRDEGFEVLALYKSIRDERRRYLLRELMRVIADEQPKVDGDGQL